MAFQIITADTIASGTAADLSTSDDIIVMAGATVGSTGGTAIDGNGIGHVVEVFGNVVGLTAAIDVGDNVSADTFQQVTIHEDALVYSGNFAVRMRGTQSTFDNAGTVLAQSHGLIFGGAGDSTTTSLTNSGTIKATSSGSDGIIRFGGATERMELLNTGLIQANGDAFDGGVEDAIDEITNDGRMIGDVKLSFGDDLYDGRLGRLTGDVLGGDGADRIFGGIDNDVFSGDAGADTLDGGNGNDSLSGGADNDTLRGGAGNDTLDGGTGNDRMEGGAGNDIFVVDSASDVEVEGANQGTDTVQSSISFALANNFENLTLTGASAINGTGNAVANVVTGNTGNNLLSGLGGNDSLVGLAGADTLTGGAGADRFVYKAVGDSTVAAAGRDTIFDFSHAQGDRINLSTIDANSGVGGNQAFAFIGTDAFSGAAGELRHFRSGANTIVQADTDGNGTADFAVTLSGNLTLVAGDFIL